MAGERTVPGLGFVKAFYTPGTSGWAEGMDTNLLGFSAVTQLAVESMTDALPGSPTDGVLYIVPSGGNAEKVAVRDNGGWVYFTPQVGWVAWVKDDAKFVYYNNSSNWVDFPSSGGGGATALDDLTDVDLTGAVNGKFLKRVGGVWIPDDAPTSAIPAWAISIKTANYVLVLGDASTTIVMNKSTTGTVTFPPNSVVAFPVGTEIELFQLGTGQLSPTAGAGVTLNALGGILASPGRYARGTARKTATDEWSVEWGTAGASGSVVTALDNVGDVTLTGVATGDFLRWDGDEWVNAKLPVSLVVAVSDETTALTTGTAKVTFRMPHAMTLTAVRASLVTPQTSGSTFTVDINEGGTTILSTKLTLDNTEKSSTTAATPAVISDAALADDAEITVDIDQVGDGTAKGLKIMLIGTL